MIVKAAQSGIQKLYHYEKFDPEYLKDTLVSRRVHVSNPRTFNDPWDCYPCFDTIQASDAVYRRRFIQFYRNSGKPDLPDILVAFVEEKLQQNSEFFVRLLQTTFRESLRNTVLERWRIYCLTPHCDSSLMWSHYSDGHQGICLEFDTCQALVGNAFQVMYRNKLPVFDALSFCGKDIFRTFLTKSPDWSYEDEYRIVANYGEKDDVALHSPPITNGGYLSLPPGAFTAVIAGCRANFSAIRALVEKHAPGLPIKRAMQASDTYSLSIQSERT